MSFNAFGKPAETVDFGGEVDYASYEWFKDPPPQSEVAPFLRPSPRWMTKLLCVASPSPSSGRTLRAPTLRHR